MVGSCQSTIIFRPGWVALRRRDKRWPGMPHRPGISWSAARTAMPLPPWFAAWSLVRPGGALQQWLSHFGTARVQLDADERFSLKNSQFDLLIPLYNQGDNLVFTQGSLHRTDSRTQANLGTGWRHFTPTYMLGGNLFGVDNRQKNPHAITAGLQFTNHRTGDKRHVAGHRLRRPDTWAKRGALELMGQTGVISCRRFLRYLFLVVGAEEWWLPLPRLPNNWISQRQR